MVISMSREFGVPLTAEDFGGELCSGYQAIIVICGYFPYLPYSREKAVLLFIF